VLEADASLAQDPSELAMADGGHDPMGDEVSTERITRGIVYDLWEQWHRRSCPNEATGTKPAPDSVSGEAGHAASAGVPNGSQSCSYR
jgi:hypothetical protein